MARRRGGGGYRANCELADLASDQTREGDYDRDQDWDYYGRAGPGLAGCLDVSQTCDEEGMEFTLRIPEGFYGRIYTHSHYGRSNCYTRGTGGTTYSLRIPGVASYPDCGTEKYGDTLSNVVVVQWSEQVQTAQDMVYNITCTVTGPRDITVTSATLGAGSGQPIPIEYLPAEHTLDSRVRLLIKYQERPTTTIAVGDPLQFKLETQDGENLLRDIFATNVIAKDPYSDRVVQLIDADGCPVDPYVFPALGISRANDGLETGFNAFKIPESNFLVFEATVRSCRSGCRPAVCGGPSGREDSFGRRRRAADTGKTSLAPGESESKVEIREMFRVYESRENIPSQESGLVTATQVEAVVCLSARSHQALVGGLVVCCLLLLTTAATVFLQYRRGRREQAKQLADFHQPHLPQPQVWHTKQPQQRYLPGQDRQQELQPPLPPLQGYRPTFPDPSEPIYTDPSLFERPRSMGTLSLHDQTEESVKL